MRLFHLAVCVDTGQGSDTPSFFLFVGGQGIDTERKAKPNLSASSIKHGHTEERRGVERGAGPSIDQLRGLRSNSLGEEEEEEVEEFLPLKQHPSRCDILLPRT